MSVGNRSSSTSRQLINDSTSRREQMEDYSQVRVYFIQGFSSSSSFSNEMKKQQSLLITFRYLITRKTHSFHFFFLLSVTHQRKEPLWLDELCARSM